jgi:hypothetical protein
VDELPFSTHSKYEQVKHEYKEWAITQFQNHGGVANMAARLKLPAAKVHKILSKGSCSQLRSLVVKIEATLNPKETNKL